ncbi:MAG: PH domain-containing protein [Patescibacteria group bacterium]|jgi:uncharacterized membrane protein YdbT with pleckstrin-like domain
MLDTHHLPNEIPGEKPVFFLRRHPITMMGTVLGYIAILLLPIAIYFYLTTFQLVLLSEPGPLLLIVLGGSTFFLFAWLFLFQGFLDYYLDTWIVTTRRVLNIEQNGLFGRVVSELRLYRIQDVTAMVNGFWNTMFDFGNVEIQTAAEHERFMFEEVPHPNQISKAILEAAELDRRDHLNTAVEEFAMADKRADKKADEGTKK